jgi:hypothetical protein
MQPVSIWRGLSKTIKDRQRPAKVGSQQSVCLVCLAFICFEIPSMFNMFTVFIKFKHCDMSLPDSLELQFILGNLREVPPFSVFITALNRKSV